jgi:hypothetical protein
MFNPEIMATIISTEEYDKMSFRKKGIFSKYEICARRLSIVAFTVIVGFFRVVILDP